MAYNNPALGGDNNLLAGILGQVSPSGSTLFEPQRVNNGLLTILATSNRVSGLANPLFDVDSKNITLALAGFSLPKISSGMTQIPYLNQVRKFAGVTQYDNVNVTVHDYVDRAVATSLWKWRLLIDDPTSGIRGVKADYVYNGQIDLFDPSAGNSPSVQNTSATSSQGVASYAVVNMWPMTVDFGDVDMGGDDNVRIGVVFACDLVYPIGWSGLSYGGTPVFGRST